MTKKKRKKILDEFYGISLQVAKADILVERRHVEAHTLFCKYNKINSKIKASERVNFFTMHQKNKEILQFTKHKVLTPLCRDIGLPSAISNP